MSTMTTKKKKPTKRKAKKKVAPNKPGRPAFVITKEVLKKASDSAAIGLTQDQIAVSLGIAPCTLYDKKNKYPKLVEAIAQGKVLGLQVIANAHFTEARNGSIVAQQFYLSRKGGWNDESTVKLTGAEGGPIKTEEVGRARDKLLGLLSSIATREKDRKKSE